MTAPKAKAKRKARPKEPIDIDTAVTQMAEQMAEYQTVMQDSIAAYDQMVAKATEDLAKLVQAATPTPPPPKVAPECQWVEQDSGKYLVMNVAAAEFFQAIFEQVGVLANELQKQTK